MTRLELLVAGVLLVCLLEVGMADILMSFAARIPTGDHYWAKPSSILTGLRCIAWIRATR